MLEEKAEEICYWKRYDLKNLDCTAFCFKCTGKYEEKCVLYISRETALRYFESEFSGEQNERS